MSMRTICIIIQGFIAVVIPFVVFFSKFTMVNEQDQLKKEIIKNNLIKGIGILGVVFIGLTIIPFLY